MRDASVVDQNGTPNEDDEEPMGTVVTFTAGTETAAGRGFTTGPDLVDVDVITRTTTTRDALGEETTTTTVSAVFTFDEEGERDRERSRDPVGQLELRLYTANGVEFTCAEAVEGTTATTNNQVTCTEFFQSDPPPTNANDTVTAQELQSVVLGTAGQGAVADDEGDVDPERDVPVDQRSTDT